MWRKFWKNSFAMCCKTGGVFLRFERHNRVHKCLYQVWKVVFYLSLGGRIWGYMHHKGLALLKYLASPSEVWWPSQNKRHLWILDNLSIVESQNSTRWMMELLKLWMQTFPLSVLVYLGIVLVLSFVYALLQLLVCEILMFSAEYNGYKYNIWTETPFLI